jgi:predicted nuclease of predicted toxin-antitoxin system
MHVRTVGLRGAEDAAIWSYAREHDFVVISKDNDFRQLSFVNGPPPKVVWLEVGNAGTAAILDLLRRERETLERFQTEAEAALLIVSLSIRAV